MHKQLKNYELPEGVLPLAPRQVFIDYTETALRKAIVLKDKYPEKKGIACKAVDALRHSTKLAPPPSGTITMEAHIDAEKIPQDAKNTLLALGFEPDGFAVFMPEHFSDHMTLKFKVARDDRGRFQEITGLMENHCREAFHLLQEHKGVTEAYLEQEIYLESMHRSVQDGALSPGWLEKFPLKPGALVNSPVSGNERLKKMDIHIKIARENSETDRKELLEAFRRAGFYPVRTWAGNDICTGQFARPKDCRAVYDTLKSYFKTCGGSSEMTMEIVQRMQRTNKNGILAAVPPLITGINAGSLDYDV